MQRRSTPHQKAKKIKRDWHLVDATSDTFGRVVGKIARYLIGKHKVEFSPHLDAGDFVVVLNAKNLKVTGAKLKDKKYYRHSWYLGSLKTETLEDRLSNNPQKTIIEATRLMLPKNSHLKARLKRLRVFEGEEHPYQKEVSGKKSLKTLS